MREVDRITWTGLAGAVMVGAAAFALAPAALAQASMKIGTATINDMQHEFAKRFAAEFDKRASGKLKIEIFPASQLGSIPRMIEGLTLGTVEAWIGPPEFLVGHDPRFQVLGAPGVVADMQHADRLIADPKFRAALLGFAEGKGIKGVGAAVYGPIVYGARKALRTAEDFKGMKIRVFASPMQTLAMEKLGATGVPMPLDEVLQALGRGTIDANRTAMGVLIGFKYHDIVKHATQIDDAMVFTVFMVGRQWFDRLPADVQKAVLDAAAAVERDVTRFAADLHAKGESTWKERGGEYLTVRGADQASILKPIAGVGDEVVARNPGIKAAYELMVERAKATAK